MPPPFSRNISNVFAEQEIKFIPESPERGNVCFLVIFHENECVYSVIARKSNSAPFQGKSETSQTVQTKEVAIPGVLFTHLTHRVSRFSLTLTVIKIPILARSPRLLLNIEMAEPTTSGGRTLLGPLRLFVSRESSSGFIPFIDTFIDASAIWRFWFR